MSDSEQYLKFYIKPTRSATRFAIMSSRATVVFVWLCFVVKSTLQTDNSGNAVDSLLLHLKSVGGGLSESAVIRNIGQHRGVFAVR